MSCIKLALIVLLAAVILERVEARPRAHIVGNHIMKEKRVQERKVSGNKTGRKHRQPKRIRLKNRNLIKSLLKDYEDYEEDYDNAPIIQIRFKRGIFTEDSNKWNNFLIDQKKSKLYKDID